MLKTLSRNIIVTKIKKLVPKCSFLEKVKRRLPYIYYINIIFILMIEILIFIAIMITNRAVDYDLNKIVDLIW